MPSVLVPLAEGFEEIEAITLKDPNGPTTNKRAIE